MKNSKKASMSKLHTLHDKLADYFIESLNSGEELSGGTLAAINAFLKNNNIVVDVVDSSPTKNLSLVLKDIIKNRNEEDLMVS
ncbi:MAG: hypothetical protein IE909_05930 [Campylobacterales bacterium]|nr:hypothetical protein [Campylobacterales bacterium]